MVISQSTTLSLSQRGLQKQQQSTHTRRCWIQLFQPHIDAAATPRAWLRRAPTNQAPAACSDWQAWPEQVKSSGFVCLTWSWVLPSSGALWLTTCMPPWGMFKYDRMWGDYDSLLFEVGGHIKWEVCMNRRWEGGREGVRGRKRGSEREVEREEESEWKWGSEG